MLKKISSRGFILLILWPLVLFSQTPPEDFLGHQVGADRIINAERPLTELAVVFALLERGEVLKCAVVP